MLVKVIKEYVKHNRVNKVGDELGVSKAKAKALIDLGLVEDVNDVLRLKKVKKVREVKAEQPKKKTKKSKK